MALCVSDTHPPSPEMLRYATVVHAALVEAGYPDAHVSVNERCPIVTTYHYSYTTGERYELPEEVADRAFEIAAPLKPVPA